MEYTINIKGRLMDLSTPQVMGILTLRPTVSTLAVENRQKWR